MILKLKLKRYVVNNVKVKLKAELNYSCKTNLTYNAFKN